jgi:acyl carrier protein
MGTTARRTAGAAGVIALCAVAAARAQDPPPDCAILPAGRIPAEVAEIVARELRVPPSRVRPESRLADLGADELGGLEVVMGLERRFGVRIDTRSVRVPPDVRGLGELAAALLARRCGR